MKTKLLTFLTLTAFMLCANVFKAQAQQYNEKLIVTDITQTSATLTFTVPGYELFLVEFRIKGSGYEETKTVDSRKINYSSATVSLTGLSEGRTYSVYVSWLIVINGKPSSVYMTSNYLNCFTTLTESKAPTVPSKTINSGTITETTIPISWTRATASGDDTPVSGLTYEIFCCTSTGELSEHMAQGFPVGTVTGGDSYTIAKYMKNGIPNSLIDGIDYYICIRVKNKSNLFTDYTVKNVKKPIFDKTPPTVANKTITVGAITNNSVAISWNKATDNVTSQNNLDYMVSWAKASAPSSPLGVHSGKNFNSFTYTDLEPNTKYEFWVFVYDEARNYISYPRVSATTTGAAADTEKPTVSNKTITASNVTATSVKLTWNAASDNVTAASKLKYKVYYCVGGSMSDVATMEANADGNSGVLTGATTYTYTLDLKYTHSINIVVEDEAGNKTAYNAITVKHTATTDTEAPTVSNPVITIGTPTATSIPISWTKATDNVTNQNNIKYYIFCVPKSDESALSAATKTDENAIVTGGNSFTITNYRQLRKLKDLEPDTEYSFVISAIDEAGNYRKYTVNSARTAAATTAVTGVTLNQTTLSLAAGASTTLTATVAPATATNKSVTWTSSNAAVATVNAAGNVTAVNAGTATVTVTTVDGAKTATCAVTVTAAADTEKPTVSNKTITASNITATSVKLTWNAASDNVTAASKLKYKVYYCVGGSMSDVATMEANADGNSGVLTGATTYTYTLNLNYSHSINIVVEDEAGNKTAYSAINVKYTATTAVTGVTLNQTTLSLAAGASTTLTATVAPATATNKSVTWTSSNAAVATVNAAGNVTAVNAGTATVTVTTADGGRTATCALTVTPPVANEAVDKAVARAAGRTLYIVLPEVQTVHIYNISGLLYRVLNAPAGETTLILPPGLYIVRMKDVATKVVIN